MTFTPQLDKAHRNCYHKFTAEKAVPKEAKRIEAKPDKSDASRVGSVRLYIFPEGRCKHGFPLLERSDALPLAAGENTV